MSLGVHPREIVSASTSPLLAAHHSWGRVEVGEIAEILNGYAFSSAHFNKSGKGMPLLRIRDVGGDGFTDAYYDGGFDDRYVVEPGELVIGMDGDFRIAAWNGRPAVLNQRVCKLTVRDPARYDERFLLHVLQGYLDAIHEVTSSVTVKHLSSKTVAQIPVPDPPLGEQRRIVEVVESHLSQLQAGVGSLQRVRRNLTRMRLLSLDRVFDDSRVRWVPLSETSRIESKLVNPKDYPDLPHIAPNHIESRTGRLLPFGTVAEDGVKSGKYMFNAGDVLYSKIRPYLAKATVAQFQGLCSADMYPLTTDLLPRFLQLWLISPRFTALAAQEQGRSVLPKINRAALFRIESPEAPHTVQSDLVEAFERRWSVLGAIEVEVTQAVRRSDRLKQSVLAAAFAGRLGRFQKGGMAA